MSCCEASAAAVRESCSSRWSSLGRQLCRRRCLLPLPAPPVRHPPASEGLRARCGPSASMLSNRSHVSSGGRLINCLAEAELLCHLTLMRLSSVSSSKTRLPVFGQLLRALMNLGSLQPRSGVSSVSFLQSHRLRLSRWCWLCLTSSACLTVCRRGYSRRATTCLRRSCAQSVNNRLIDKNDITHFDTQCYHIL